LLAQLAMSPAATTTGSPVVCLVLCCAPVCRVASVACSALRRGAPCLKVCFGVTSCEPQPTARRIAKARIPTAIGATLLIVPMATIPSRFFSFAFAPCSINCFLSSNSSARRAHPFRHAYVPWAASVAAVSVPRAPRGRSPLFLVAEDEEPEDHKARGRAGQHGEDFGRVARHQRREVLVDDETSGHQPQYEVADPDAERRL
jgi:hypothetical protein